MEEGVGDGGRIGAPRAWSGAVVRALGPGAGTAKDMFGASVGASGLVTAYLSTPAIKVSHLGRGEDNGDEDDHRICGRALFRSMRIMSRSHLKESGSSQVTLDGLQVLLRNAQHVLLGIIPVTQPGIVSGVG